MLRQRWHSCMFCIFLRLCEFVPHLPGAQKDHPKRGGRTPEGAGRQAALGKAAAVFPDELPVRNGSGKREPQRRARTTKRRHWEKRSVVVTRCFWWSYGPMPIVMLQTEVNASFVSFCSISRAVASPSSCACESINLPRNASKPFRCRGP